MKVKLAHALGTITLVLTTCVGCGCDKTAPADSATTPTSARVAAPSAEPDGTHVDPRGRCGGLAALALDGTTRLLQDRIRIRLPRGSPHGALSEDETATEHLVSQIERARLARGEASLFIAAIEIHRSTGASLTEDAVLRAAPPRSRIAPLPGAPEGVIAVTVEQDAEHADEEVAEPDSEEAGEEEEADEVEEALEAEDDDWRNVELLRAFVRTQDALVVEVRFETTRAVAAFGGCDTLARTLAAGLVPGERDLVRVSGRRSLTHDLGITLPEGHAITLAHGEDYASAAILPIAPLGAPSATLGIYRGGFGELSHPRSATSRSARILGRSARWWTWTDREGIHREALVPMGEWTVQLDIEGTDPAMLERLTAIATTLTTSPPARVAPVCAPSGVFDGVRAVDSEDVRALASARRFARARAALGEPSVPEALAFARVLATDDAADAFLFLAARGNTVGKLYGLAGLALVDRARLDAAYCAVRDSLDEDVQVVDLCGAKTERARTIAFATDPHAVTGEAHWGMDEWWIAAMDHPTDVYGGAVGYGLAHGALGQSSLEELVQRLGTEGASAMNPAALSPARGAPVGENAPLRVFTGDMDSGLCVVRADGRVGCWGSALVREGIELAPDLVRHPAHYVRGVRQCMLDAEGERVCMGNPTEERRRLAEACGAQVPEGLVMKRYDDGPYSALFARGVNACGLHGGGSLRCFDESERATRIDIPGRVVGASTRGTSSVYAFTDDGHVFAVDSEDHVRLIGEHAGIVDLEAGYDGNIFARLGDGRVLAYGERARGTVSALPYYARGWGDGVWREVPELRGARIFAESQHACALYPDGRVSCFGRGDNGERGAPVTSDETPRDVPALRGASTLLVQNGATCGRFDRARLVCVGWNVPALTLAPENQGALGPVTIDLARVHQAPLPVSPQSQSSASDRTSTGGR